MLRFHAWLDRNNHRVSLYLSAAGVITLAALVAAVLGAL